MTTITLSFIDDTPTINKPLSWGIHKELASYLIEEGRLLSMFTDEDIMENVLQICLSERDDLGNTKAPFTKVSLLDTKTMLEFLQELYDYFENFFFQNQQRVESMTKKFQALQASKA